MKKVVYYISDDNITFESEYDCFAHEAQMLFNTDALKFYDKSGHRLKLDNRPSDDHWEPFDRIYNNFHRVVVDRNNEHTSKVIGMLIDDFGWCMLEPLLDDDGTVYVLRQGDEYQYGEALVKLH